MYYINEILVWHINRKAYHPLNPANLLYTFSPNIINNDVGVISEQPRCGLKFWTTIYVDVQYFSHNLVIWSTCYVLDKSDNKFYAIGYAALT